MLIKSQIITQMSGSIGGITGSHNAAGMYLRARNVPVNPQTIYQSVIRAAIATLANRWIDVLTAGQRSGWSTYAANVAMTGKLGQEIYLSGMNHYVRSNVPRLQDTIAPVDDAPGVFNLGSFTLPVLTATESTQVISLAFENTDAWANEAGGYMFLADSRPQNITRNYFKGPFRFADTVIGAVSPPTSPENHAATFTIVEGQRVFGHVRVCRADGRLASAAIVNVIVVA